MEEFIMYRKTIMVALCKKCKGLVFASTADRITKSIEQEFAEFSNEGFDVKIETLAITNSFKFVFYSDKKNGNCEECNKN